MTITTPDLNELAAEIHQTAVDHGWWEEDRDFDELCFLMTTELAEAFEEYRESKPLVYYGPSKLREDGKAAEDSMGNWLPSSFVCKPEGTVTEIADCVIRALDTLLTMTDELNSEIRQNRGGVPAIPNNVGKCFRLIDKRINKAADNHALGYPRKATTDLLIVIVMCEELATKLGCEDFWAVVREKMAYNDTRSYKHGGKVA